MNLLQLTGSVEIGLIYSLVAIGVYISFRVIDFPDLTADGSFTLGASVAAIMLINDFDPVITIAASMLAGALAGGLTGYLNARFNIAGLLASILTMTALYSINLRIMGRPNIAIVEQLTIFDDKSVILVTLVIVSAIIVILSRFFASEFGLSLRAVGINTKLCAAYGINVGRMKIIALALSNALIALSGNIFVQSQGFADISMGTGTIIIGLASIIIGESLISPKKIYSAFIACLFGAILYRIIIGFALNLDYLGFEASDLNLVTASLVAMTMIAGKFTKRRNLR